VPFCRKAHIGPVEVGERYGVQPRQCPIFTALRGDPSDQSSGMRGVGPKGAAMLLRRYGTLEQALAEGRRHEQSDELRRYKRIATMDPQCCFPS
jgi:DNA polymerase I